MSKCHVLLRGSAAAFILAFCTLAGAAPALAQAKLTLPAADLASSLKALSRTAGVEILADPILLRGKMAPAVQGATSAETALQQLLRRSGLRYEKRGGAFLIIRGPEVRPSDAETSSGSLKTSRAGLERPTPVAAAMDSADAQGEIVVTGSRIVRPELESAMPVSVLKFDDAANIGRMDAYDVLRRSPALAPGTGVYESQDTSRDLGLATVNLRNLGANRSLTLIDGRRRVPGSGTTSAVDINMIPAAMIDRIEVVTGGAAAIYGADAVTGAVNIITKNDLEGLNISAYKGISQAGDAPETQVSAAIGGKFAEGRGSFSIGGTYSDIALLEQGDREISRKRLAYLSNPDNRGPNDGIPDVAINPDYQSFFVGDKPGFYIPNNKTYYVYGNGQLSTYQYDKFWTPPGELSGGQGSNDPSLYNFQLYFPLRTGQRNISAIAKVGYELIDGVTYGAQLDYGHTRGTGSISFYREDSRTVHMSPHGGAVAYLDNPFMPASVRELLTSFGIDHINVDRRFVNWPWIEHYEDREQINILQTLSGTLTDSIRWEGFYQYGRMTRDEIITNMPLKSRWVAARDVIADPSSGLPVCRDEAARARGCTPINIFAYTEPLTQEQKDWLFYDRHSRRTNTQEMYGASLNGRLIDLPYGAASFAIGAERRTESLESREDPLALSGEAATGSQLPAQQPINAKMNVTEFYGELVAPLLRDLPFANRLSVEGAYRYSDYDAFGSTNTWKAGATWSPLRSVTFRGVRSRSVRAPNFGELYQPIVQSFTSSFNDPCLRGNYARTPTRAANCAATGAAVPLDFYYDIIDVTSGGNPNLKPETSDSTTVGVVFQPTFIRGFDATIDYWNINIKDIVTSFSAERIANYCVDLPTIDNPFCPFIRRGPDGKPVHISTQLLNASSMRAKGIDIGVNYRARLGGGHLAFNFLGSYLLKREIETIPGVASSILHYDGAYTDPRFRGSLLTSYSIGDFSIALDTRFISAAQYDPNVSDEYYERNDVPSRVYNDIVVHHIFGDKLDIGIGMKNIFDVDPPYIPTLNTGGGGRYDTIGRYFFTTVKVKL